MWMCGCACHGEAMKVNRYFAETDLSFHPCVGLNPFPFICCAEGSEAFPGPTSFIFV